MPRLFRYATEQDAKALHDLIQAAFAEYIDNIPVPPGALGDTLEDVRTATLTGRTLLAFDVTFTQEPEMIGDTLNVIKDGNLDIASQTLVGTARYEPREGHLYIGRVAVHPDYRRMGIGIELMQQIEQLAPQLGYTRLYLGTRASMPGNLAFYERLGYSIVQQEPHSRGPDVNVWFEKELTNVDTAETLLHGIIEQLHQLPGQPLDRVTYCPLDFELDHANLDAPLFYTGGEVTLHFHNIPPIYLYWHSNAGWGGAFSLRVSSESSFIQGSIAIIDTSPLSIWHHFIGLPLREVDVLGWHGVPHICRFGFDAGSIYIGSGHMYAFGDGDDLIVASEEGWQSLNLQSPELLAHLTPDRNSKLETRNSKLS